MSASTSNPSPPVVPDLLRSGDVVDGRYRIDGPLGGGGMAFVYRATHLALDQPVAIKVVSPQIRAVPGVAQRFLREARAATQLKGGHVVRVFDVGTTETAAPYMVMEYLEGMDIDEVVAARGPLEPAQAVDWILQACEALAEVHGVGIVHRDLKPANLFVTRGADGLPSVKLIDFGISRFDAPIESTELLSLTHPEQIMGSPRYMPPEQMESAANADVRSDIWGIGAVLYEMLVGRPPYDGASYWDIYVAAKRDSPPAPSGLRPGIPSGLDDVVLRCLRAEPEERWADVAELARALAPYGPPSATERANAIERVLDASRARSRSAAPSPDTLAAPARPAARTPAPNDEPSRVRRRISPAVLDVTRADERPTIRSFVFTLMLAAVAVALMAAGARVMLDRANAAPPAPPTTGLVATPETAAPPPPAPTAVSAATATANAAPNASAATSAEPVERAARPSALVRAARPRRAPARTSPPAAAAAPPASRPTAEAPPEPPETPATAPTQETAPENATPPSDDRRLFEERK